MTQGAQPNPQVSTGQSVVADEGHHRSAAQAIAMDRDDQRDLKLTQQPGHAVPSDEALDVHLADSKLLDIDPSRK